MTRKNRGTRRATTRKAPRKSSRKTVRGKSSTVKLIKSVLNRSSETKYVAQQSSIAGLYIKGSINPPADFISVFPPVSQQTTVGSNNVREGDVIQPTGARLSGHVYWAQAFETLGNAVAFVKLILVQAKRTKYLPTANFPVGLLEAGLGDPTAWNSAGGSQQSYFPISKENYTVIGTRTVKLSKNTGLPVGSSATGDTTNIGMDRVPFSFSWKPPTLKYAEDGDLYPQNHAPILFAVGYCPGLDFDVNQNLQNAVKFNWTCDMYFKDM